MIVYSVTVSIESAIMDDWFNWMTKKHIPDVMATGYFLDSNIHRLLEPAPQQGMYTFNIQYLCEDLDKLEIYQQEVAPALQEEHTERYKDRFVAFRTILQRY